jgi:hypothetical protein
MWPLDDVRTQARAYGDYTKIGEVIGVLLEFNEAGIGNLEVVRGRWAYFPPLLSSPELCYAILGRSRLDSLRICKKQIRGMTVNNSNYFTIILKDLHDLSMLRVRRRIKLFWQNF